MDEKTEFDTIKYIKNHICELSKEDRIGILQILIDNLDDDKIQDKGNGTEIKFKHIPKEIKLGIHAYIQNKLAVKMTELQHFPDNK